LKGSVVRQGLKVVSKVSGDATVAEQAVKQGGADDHRHDARAIARMGQVTCGGLKIRIEAVGVVFLRRI
jgi:hypothetical protein